ncbi:hypothetical protein [Nitrospira sp. Nam80]
MSGIELFLTTRIYGAEQHPRSWDKYIYDDENIHCGLIQLLAEKSPTFVQVLLGLSCVPQSVSILYEPEQGLFDFALIVNGSPIYCELKVWANLTEKQFIRQIGFLAQRNARGIYLLFTKAADAWPADVVARRSDGLCDVVGIGRLLEALEAIDSDVPADGTEVAGAYRKVLKHLNARWGSIPLTPHFGCER